MHFLLPDPGMLRGLEGVGNEWGGLVDLGTPCKCIGHRHIPLKRRKLWAGVHAGRALPVLAAQRWLVALRTAPWVAYLRRDGGHDDDNDKGPSHIQKTLTTQPGA